MKRGDENIHKNSWNDRELVFSKIFQEIQIKILQSILHNISPETMENVIMKTKYSEYSINIQNFLCYVNRRRKI